jgi:hypothetical protein
VKGEFSWLLLVFFGGDRMKNREQAVNRQQDGNHE